MHIGPVQNRFNALPNPIRSFILSGPDWVQDCFDMRKRDFRRVESSDYGKDIVAQRVVPLLGMFFVSPPWRSGSNVGFSAALKSLFGIIRIVFLYCQARIETLYS